MGGTCYFLRTHLGTDSYRDRPRPSPLSADEESSRVIGRFRGRRKLTKKGEPELRRLLFNAAMQGRRNPLWEPYYLSLRQRGFSTTAAFVVLGRKLARVCFALLRNETDFNPDLQPGACALFVKSFLNPGQPGSRVF